MLAMSISLAADPNIADWISSIGQAAGALFTAVAVVVALWISHRDSRQRAKDEHAKSRAQAKLVLVKGPEIVDLDQKDPKKNGIVFAASILNIGDRPILEVKFDILAADEGALRRLGSMSKSFLDPTTQTVYEYLRVYAKNGVALSKWRISWEDPDGLEWEVLWSNGRRVLQPKSAKPWDDFQRIISEDDR